MTGNPVQSHVAETDISTQRFLCILGLIGLAGFLLRWFHLSGKDLCFWDEGIFLMGAKFLRWRSAVLVKMCLNAMGGSFFVPGPDSYQGYPVFLQKPFHVILLTGSSLVFGLTKWTGAVHSAMYGVGTIMLTGCLGRYLAGTVPGLIAASWLAFQPYHVFYSRLGLHEMDSMFILLLGSLLMFVWLKTARAHHLFWAGLLLMLAIGTSYRLFIMVGLLVCLVIGRSMAGGTVKAAIRGVIFLVAGAVMALILLELSYRLAFSPDYLWSQPSSYMALLKKKFISSESSFDMAFPLYYCRMFTRFDGWFPSLVTGVAVIYLLFKRSFRLVMVTVLFLVPFLVFSLTSTRLARTPTGLLPWGALAVGVFISDFGRHATFLRTSIRYFVAGGLGCAILISFGLNLIPIYKIQSGYGPVMDFLDSQGAECCLSTMKPIFAFHKDRHYVDTPGETVTDLCRQVRETGVRYLCLDWQKFVRYQPSFRAVETASLPVFVSLNPVTKHVATLYENYLPGDVPVLPELDPTLYYIKVYDLYTVLPQLGCHIEQSETLTGKDLHSE
jgi:4-amino-4-deoxy-L-arabinose transferase-like glycosyltransferase